MNFTFAPIHSIGQWQPDGTFDSPKLPFHLLDELAIEELKDSLPKDAFDLWAKMVGESASEKIGHMRYAFVLRYESNRTIIARSLVDYASACLRLVRPMRQHILTSAHGVVTDSGHFDVQNFQMSGNISGTEVVEAHKLNTLRASDVERLHSVLPKFVEAMSGDFWKFRMAAQFHDLGYFQSTNWKPRFLLWTSAIESIFTSHSSFEHRGSIVAKARIKWFLGGRSRIYPDHEMPWTIDTCELTLDDVLDSMYELRNIVAHGDKVPDAYFNTEKRIGINGGVLLVEVISEAASFIIRTSLVKILEDGLLNHFVDAQQAEAFFEEHGLIKSLLRRT